jgi:carbonic anhydrase
LQFHVHTSSEHTIDGSLFGAELHVVHKATDANRFAVVGFVIDPSSAEDDPLFDDLLAGWSNVAAMTDEACGRNPTPASMANAFTNRRSQRFRAGFNTFNVYDFVEGAMFYHYDGGLTTPPCSEVVWWNLASVPVKISVSQYQLLAFLTINYRSANSCRPASIASPSGSTSRPVQPLFGRKVEKICPAMMA